MGHMALSQEEHKIIAQKSMAYESICVGGALFGSLPLVTLCLPPPLKPLF